MLSHTERSLSFRTHSGFHLRNFGRPSLAKVAYSRLKCQSSLVLSWRIKWPPRVGNPCRGPLRKSHASLNPAYNLARFTKASVFPRESSEFLQRHRHSLELLIARARTCVRARTQLNECRIFRARIPVRAWETETRGRRATFPLSPLSR
jgi:hypothetical protein